MANDETRTRDHELGYIGRVTLLGTAASLAFSLLVNYLLLFSETLSPFARSMITAVAVPIAVGAPLSFLLAYNRRELRRFRRELTHTASHDPATELLNSTAFSSVVDRRATIAAPQGQRSGAFLMVNADNLKSINIRYGLAWGEEALRIVASTIRGSVRREDIIGRLGESEFGIFLPGATEEDAREVGERIRAAVARVYFAPAEAKDQSLLNVSVAGVVFEKELEFDGMYRAVEQRLTSAEASGGVEIARLASDPANGPRTAH